MVLRQLWNIRFCIIRNPSAYFKYFLLNVWLLLNKMENVCFCLLWKAPGIYCKDKVNTYIHEFVKFVS